MSIFCPQTLRDKIKQNQSKIASEVIGDFKPVSELKETYPNIYLILQLLPPLKPIAENVSKFSELYPFFIKACRERNSMYPEGFFKYKAKRTGLSPSIIKQLSQLKVPQLYNLDQRSTLCAKNMPIDTYIEHVYDNNPLLKKFRSFVAILYGDINNSRYFPDEDVFKITINKTDCKNHQFLTLVHHLGYANFWITQFQAGINPYDLGNFAACKAAITFDHQTLKEVPSDLYSEFLQKESNMINLLAFEIDLYLHLPDVPKTQFCVDNLQSPYLFLSKESLFTQPLENITHVAAYLSSSSEYH